MISPVAEVSVVPLRASTEPTDLDSSAETVLVRVLDEDGREGIGEADAPAQVVRQLIEMDDLFDWSRGLRNVVLGMDPVELQANQARMYEATLYHGRRGTGVHALSALDIALHDLAGKQLERPTYHLLGGARQQAITPYATIWPGGVGGRSIEQMMAVIEAGFRRAIALGFRAVKMEVIFGELVTDRELAACIRDGRRMLGDDITMLVDFGYRWRDWRDALWVLDRVEDCDIYLAEATLQHDDLDGHAKLAGRVRTRVGGAELAATVHECREWLERGRVDVLQPDPNRCGGLTELRRIAQMAELSGASVIPHGWKTGITAAAGRQFQAATVNAPFVEMLSPELFRSPLRAELVRPEPIVEAGTIPLPTEPGLGVEIQEEAVARYRTG